MEKFYNFVHTCEDFLFNSLTIIAVVAVILVVLLRGCSTYDAEQVRNFEKDKMKHKETMLRLEMKIPINDCNCPKTNEQVQR